MWNADRFFFFIVNKIIYDKTLHCKRGDILNIRNEDFMVEE